MGSEDRGLVRGPALAWAWVLCLALALRALVPVGYMPDFAGGSLPGITLCSMQTPGLRGMTNHADHSGSGSAYDNPLHFVAQCLGGAPLPVAAIPADMAFVGALSVFLFTTANLRPLRVRSAPVGSRAPPPPLT